MKFWKQFAALKIPIRRSRKGAWIEIVAVDKSKVGFCGRSRKGAWIEITTPQGNLAAYGRRSRKGAWIEIEVQRYNEGGCVVAPVRERGLKSAGEQQSTVIPASLP